MTGFNKISAKGFDFDTSQGMQASHDVNAELTAGISMGLRCECYLKYKDTQVMYFNTESYAVKILDSGSNICLDSRALSFRDCYWKGIKRFSRGKRPRPPPRTSVFSLGSDRHQGNLQGTV